MHACIYNAIDTHTCTYNSILCFSHTFMNAYKHSRIKNVHTHSRMEYVYSCKHTKHV